MSMFVSTKERNLWLGALAAVCSLGVSLAFGGSLVKVLSERGRLDMAFAAGFGLVLLTIVTQGFTSRPDSRQWALGLGLVTAAGMAVVRLGIPAAERTHLVEFGILAALVYGALKEQQAHGEGPTHPGWMAFFLVALIGMADEGIQYFIPKRVFDGRDILFNLCGTAGAILACGVLGWIQGKWSEKRS